MEKNNSVDFQRCYGIVRIEYICCIELLVALSIVIFV